MISDPWFYAAAVPAMLILGLAKGGFGVVGILTVPILSIAISPVQAAGITLPILMLVAPPEQAAGLIDALAP